MIDIETPISKVKKGDIEIPIVGGDTPSTIDDLNSTIEASLLIIGEYLITPTNVVAPVYDTPKTLYTPAATHTKYVIRKRYDNTGYNVIWLDPSHFEVINHKNTQDTNFYLSKDLYIISNSSLYLSTPSSPTINTYGQLRSNSPSGSYDSGNAYLSSTFSTLQEAIDAIQSNQTTYTISTSNWYNCAYNFDLITNCKVIVYSRPMEAGRYAFDTPIKNNQRISENETIEVIE